MNLLAVEEGLAALDGEAQGGGLERLLEGLDAGEPPREDEHVAGAARPHRARDRVADGLASPGDAGEEGGEARGLRVEEVLAARVRRRGEAQRDHGGLLGEPGGRRDRLVGRLVGLLRGQDELGEDAVHEAQDGGAGAEVLHEVQHGAALRGLRLARELAEEAHLGAAEAVDRLLGVAHHHERPGAVPGEEARDLDLERVGVLELVDDQVAEAAAVPLAHARVVAQRVARHQQEVEEVEDAPLGLLPRVQARDAAQGPDEPAVEVRAPGRGPGSCAPAFVHAAIARPSASASAEGQCGRKPKLDWTAWSASR